MVGRATRIGLLIVTVLVILPLPVWAGSSQAALAVGVVVPARCAVRMPDSLASTEVPVASSRNPVAMRCTKGSLPSATGTNASPGAVGPRITRDLVAAAAPSVATAPRPLSETGSAAGTDGPRLVITVNF
jgi:hypothetical protein